jgi:hypothetical protein
VEDASDTTRRGYRREEILASLEKRREDAQNTCPQRIFADIVIHFQKPQGANGSDTQPTCAISCTPDPAASDFSPLFDGSTNAGLRLELSVT